MRRSLTHPKSNWNRRAFAALALALGAAAGLSGCATTDLPTGGEANIDADARAVLQQMSDTLAGAKEFTVTGTRRIDSALLMGTKLPESSRFEAAVRRPGNIVSKSVGGGARRNFYLNGGKVTLFNVDQNHYAQVKAGRTIDKTIDILSDDWGFTPPLSDLLVSDPFASLTGASTSGKLVGTKSVGGTACDHIAVEQEGLAWEIWVGQSDKLPRRFEITFVEQTGKPKIRATLSNWNLSPGLASSNFAFDPPADAVEIDIAPNY